MMYMAYPPQQMPNQQFMRPGMTDDRNQVFYMQQPGMMPGHPMQGYTPGGHMMAMAAGRPIQIGGMRGGHPNQGMYGAPNMSVQNMYQQPGGGQPGGQRPQAPRPGVPSGAQGATRCHLLPLATRHPHFCSCR